MMGSSAETDFSKALTQKRGSWAKVSATYCQDKILEWITDDTFCSDAKTNASEESVAKLLKNMNVERLCYLYINYKPEPLVLREWYMDVTGIASDILVKKFAQLSAATKVSFFRKMCAESYKGNSPQKFAQAILLQNLSEKMTWPVLVKPVFRLVTGLQLGIDPVANADDIVDAYRFLCHYLLPVS